MCFLLDYVPTGTHFAVAGYAQDTTDFCQKGPPKMQFLREMGVRRPVAGPIILLGHVLSFQTSPTLCSNSTVCWRTTSDKWTHKPKMSIFDQNAKPPASISRGLWGYTRQTSSHSPPSRSKLLKYAWLKSHKSMGMQPEHRGGRPMILVGWCCDSTQKHSLKSTYL